MVISGGYGASYMGSSKRKTGGRRPKEEEDDVGSDLGPEELEKRRLRRLRNKEAAARCRQRRLNHMQALQAQVNALENENKKKQEEIDSLQQERDELFQILQSHHCNMKNGATKQFLPSPPRRQILNTHQVKVSTPEQLQPQVVKVEPLDPTLTQVVTMADSDFSTTTSMALSRPSSLPFETPSSPGVQIQTPTAGFGGYDLLGQSTGLTPVTNTGLTPILTLGGCVTTCGSLSLETPTGMDTTCGGIPVKTTTTLQNL